MARKRKPKIGDRISFKHNGHKGTVVEVETVYYYKVDWDRIGLTINSYPLKELELDDSD